MRLDRRQRFSSALSILLLVTMLLGTLAPFGSLYPAEAQDSTTEPTPSAEPTASPQPETTEATQPTEPAAPTETAPPTATPLPETTEAATTTPPTAEPTELPLPIVPQVYTEDFQDGEAQGWLLSAGWALVTEGEQRFLATTGAFETAALTGLSLDSGSIRVEIGLDPGNTANAAFRVGQDNYNVTLDATGHTSLYQGLALLAEAPASAAPAEAFSTYLLDIQIVGGQITVGVNGMVQISYTAAAPLPAGMVIFSTGQANTGTVTLDTVVIEPLPAPFIPPTAQPTETPPTEVVETAQPTPTPEVTVEATPEATTEATPEATETPEVTPEAPAGPSPLLAADFEGELVGWRMSETNAAVVESDGGHALRLDALGLLQPDSALFMTDLRIDARVQWINGTLSVVFRSSEGRAYQVTLAADQTALYRLGDAPVIETTPEATAEATAAADESSAERAENTPLASAAAARTPGVWYLVRLEAEGGLLTVTVDGTPELTYTDDAPLLGGEFAFVAGADSALLVDDVAVYDLAEAGPVIETPTPIILSEANRLKLTGALANVMQSHFDGDTAGALALAGDHFMATDELSRVKVVVWGVPGMTSDAVAALVTASGGAITFTGGRSVEAFVSLDGLLALVNQDAVAAITLPEAAVSTGPSNSEAPSQPLAGGGTIRPHSLDILGVNSWHTYRGPDGSAAAGVTGTGIKVGVIDTGFSGTISAEQGCLASSAVEGGAGGTNHGLNVVEIICDIAPNASVYMYRAGNGTELITAINEAAGFAANSSGFPTAMDVILIAVDTGVTGAGIDDAITQAATLGNSGLGIPIIASAGNTGESDALFDFAGGTTDLIIHTSAGALISYSWDDPTGTAVYPSTLSLNGDVIDSQQVRLDAPSFQYVVPQTCGDSCTLTLSISGSETTQIELRVAGGGDDNTLAMADGSEVSHPQALTTPANAANAIAVGAVCANQGDRYPLVSSSSRGANGQPNNGNIKPEIVAPAYVQTSFNPAQPACETTGFGGTSASAAHVAGMTALLLSNTNNVAMANYFSNQRATRVEGYLMTRSVDLTDDPSTGAADNSQLGFDRFYGAGLAVLGNPDYNIAEQINFPSFATPTGLGADLLDTEAIYVGTASLPLGVTVPDGSPSNPYIHPQQAIQVALAQNKTHVVFQPGEYVASFFVGDFNAAPGGTTTNLAQDLNLISYAEADLGVSLGSAIWVSDTFKGTGGILVQNVIGTPTAGLAINGFDFAGATPLYLTDVPSLKVGDVTPVYISDSDNVSLLNNTFDQFDRPLVIELSDNITIDNGTFTRFIARDQTINNNTIPFYKAAVLDIYDTGDTTDNSVRIYNSTFRNNSINSQQNANRIQESIISCEISQCDIRTSRFESNSAQAVILINQWLTFPTDTTKPGGTFVNYPTWVFSSLFNGNTLSGPLVHLVQNNQFRFINNTVVNHDMLNAESSIVLIGYPLTTEGIGTSSTHIADHRIEMHNNLFFNNEVGGGLFNSAGASFGVEGCKQIGVPEGGGQPRNGAQNNWFIPFFSMGECAVSTGGSAGFTGTGTNNNQFTNLQITGDGSEAAIAAFEDARFFMDYDPDNPYRLRPQDINDPNNPTPPQGVDGANAAGTPFDGGNAFATTIITDMPNAVDVMGLPRFIDRTGPLPFTAAAGCGAQCRIDVGAYELAIADPVSYIGDNGNFTVTILEDTPAVVIQLDTRVTGGFRPYSFTISNPPSIYNTSPNSPCAGQPYFYEIDPADPDSRYRLIYCPPEDFNTGTQTPQEIRDSIRFTYQASGLIVTTPTPPAQITINITPEDDTTPPIVAEKQVIFAQVGEVLNYRLRPYVDFAPNFAVSDPGDEDYNWTFSNVVPRTGDGQSTTNWEVSFGNNQTETLAALEADIADGRLNGTPQPGWEGVVEFSYRVTDSDGDTNANARILRLIVTRKLATAGLHDDTSLSFVYQNNWLPYFYEPGINNTLHYTITPNSTTSFYFIGDSFMLQYLGFAGASNFQILIDPDDTGPIVERNYNAAEFGLTCTNPAKPSTLTANSAVTGNLFFGCSGLNEISADGGNSENQLHKLTLKHTGTTGQYFMFDAITVRNEALTEGLYEEWDNLALKFTNNWISGGNPAAVGGRVNYTNVPAAEVEFLVDGSEVSTVVIYYTIFSNAGDMQVFVNGALRGTITGNGTATLWAQPFVITNIPAGNVLVEVRKTGGTQYVVVEAVELIGADDPLEIGTYNGEDERLRYLGRWLNYAGNGPTDRTLRYGSDRNGAAVFTINGSGVVIHHTRASNYGQFEVCVGTTCQTFNSTNAATIWSSPATVRSASSGIQTVTIRKLDSLFVGVDRVEVLGAQPVLQPGLYEDNDINLNFSGVWTTYSASNLQGGSFAYTSSTAASVSFLMDASAMDQLAIIYPINIGYGTMQVCGTICTQFNQSGTAYRPGSVQLISKASLGYTTQTSATVTIRSFGGGLIALEAIQIVKSGSLTPGYYEETLTSSGFNITYEGTDSTNDGYGAWSPYRTANLRGGNMVYANSTTAVAKFTIVPDQISGITFYYTTGSGSSTTTSDDYGTFQVFSGDTTTCTVGNNCVEVPNIPGSGYVYGRSIFLTKAQLGLGAGGAPVQITLRPKVSGPYVGIEGLAVMDANPLVVPNDPLQTLPNSGITSPSDSRIQYIGPWTDYVATGPLGGLLRYSGDRTAALRFKIDGQGVAIYRTLSSTYGTMEICIDDPIAANCQTFNNRTSDSSSNGLFYGQPAVLRAATSGIHIVEVRNVPSSTGSFGFIGIEGIEVLGSQPTLPVDTVIEETSTALRHTGTWVPFRGGAGTQGGTLNYTTDTTSTISVQVNATQFDRLAIYHPYGSGWSALRVCGPAGEPNCVSTAVATTPTIYGRATLINKAALGLTNQTNANVTLKNAGGGAAGFEGMMLISSDGTTPLTPGYYEETEQATQYNLVYNGTDTANDNYGGWTLYTSSSLRGGSFTYTNRREATAQFRVIPDNIDGIVLYLTGGAGYGALEVFSGADCQIGTNCFVAQNPAATGLVTSNRVYIPKASLNITGAGAATITLRTQTEGLYVGLEALHIISANLTTAPSNLPTLPAGRSAANSANLRYIGRWSTYLGTESLQDVLTYSNDINAAIMFQVDNAEGLALWRILSPSYGAFEICIDGNLCQSFTSLSTATQWSKRVFLRAPSGTQHVVEIRNRSTAYLGVESIDVLAPQALLTAGVYDETDTNLKYSIGNWFSTSLSAGYGGTAVYSNDPAATVTFKVDGDTTQSIGLYYSIGNNNVPSQSWVPLKVCNGSTCVETPNQGLPLRSGLFALFTRAQLGLTTGETTLTISQGSFAGYVIFEGLEVRGPVGPVSPGLYQQDNYNFTYSTGWITATSASSYSGGTAIYTDAANATLSFALNANASGFVIFSRRSSNGAPMKVCYTRQGGVEYCPTNFRPVDTFNSATQTYYGYAFYGLQTGATHNVVITNQGTTGEFLLIDAIAVLQAPTTTLTVPLNETVARFDDNNAAFVYGDSTAWRASTASGYYQNTINYTTITGATMQFRIEGNSATVYQPTWTGGSREVRYCLVINIGNDTTRDNLDCSSFSQYDPAVFTYQSPITLYGFGFGTHDLVLDNRGYGGYVILDSIEIR